jgi:hypothetical protein
MKKLFMIVVLVVVAGGSGYLIYRALTPKSDKLREQYQTFIASIDETRYKTTAAYRFEVDEELRTRRFAMASAYNADKKPDEAIILLEGLIASMNKQQYVLDKKVRRNSGQAELVAIYYESLAASYGMKHDEEKRAWALQKSNEYREEAVMLEKRGLKKRPQRTPTHGC